MVEAYKVRHKVACKECPFRRKAPAGWLGPDPLDFYTTAITFDVPISCHRTREKKRSPAACAGSLIHMRNQMKLPRSDEALRVEMMKVEPDPAAVFQWSHEFAAHHERGLIK